MAYIQKRGDSYRITVSLGRDDQDKKILKTTTYHPTMTTPAKIRKEVEEFARDYEKRVLNGEYIDGDEITFKEFAETVWKPNWLERSSSTTPRVKEDYLRILNARIIPAIGQMKLGKVRATHIDAILHQMADQGRAAKTIRHTFTVVNSVMKYAFKKQYIRENPCLRCDDLPTVKRDRDLHYFTIEQAKTFLAALDREYKVEAPTHTRKLESGEYTVAGYEYSQTISTMWKAYFYMAIFGGFRRGEMCALTWEDITFNEVTKELIVRINKAAALTKGNGQIVKDPKTESSVRDIVVPNCFDVFRKWKTEEREMMMEYGSAWEGRWDDFEKQNVFIQVQNGAPIRVDTPTHKFREILNRYNASCESEDQKLPIIRLHDLRHTMATLLLAENTNIETVSHRLGHSKASITLDVYGHALPDKDRQAAQALEKMFA